MSEITKDGDHVTIKPGRDVVASIADEFKAELNDLVGSSKGGLTIDLSGVEMVDSVGIGVIIATHNSLNKESRKLTVINISKDIFNLFNTMRLNRHFTIEAAE